MKIRTKVLRLPIIQGGMGVGVSLSGLAGHVASCGAMGTISSVNAGYADGEFLTNPVKANLKALAGEIHKAKEIAGGNGLVAVNIMTAVSHYEETCRCAVEAGADAIISGAGLPLTLPEYTRGSDTLCAPIVSSGRAARLLIRHYRKHYDCFPDFLLIEGSRAGGHLGFSAEELEDHTAKTNEEILRDVLAEAGDIPVFVAGGVFDGADMARMIGLGAAGVQIATRFIATDECDASDVFKQMIVHAKEEDIRIIKSPVGMPARAIDSPLLKRLDAGETFPPLRCSGCLTACPRNASIPYCISRALIEAVKGNPEDGLFFAGSNAGRVDRIVPVRELIDEIMKEYEENRR